MQGHLQEQWILFRGCPTLKNEWGLIKRPNIKPFSEANVWDTNVEQIQMKRRS